MCTLKRFENFILLAAVFAVGLFNEYLASAAAVALSVRLLVQIIKNKQFLFKINLVIVSVFLIALFYLVSPFWAVDFGLAFVGFFKFLPVPLYLLTLFQDEYTDDLSFLLPVSAVFMTVVSFILSLIPSIATYFTVAGRLSGFFQYSNTYALYLLISLLLLFTREHFKLLELAFTAVLVFGILCSGSRTVFLLTLVSVPVAVLFTRKKKLIFAVIGLLVVGIVAAIIYVIATENATAIGRFLTISLKESTFLGRLLYYKDALPVILKHPFGLGYMGYYYSQQSFQTGVYAVAFVHNDFLQLLLDVGWIPTLIFVAATVKSFFKKGISPIHRIIILVFAAHSCFDFNLSFIAMFIIYVLFLDWNSGKQITIKSILPTAVVLLTCLLASCYFTVVQTLTFFKVDELAVALYPCNTVSNLRLLTEAEDAEEMHEISENILEYNQHISLAYSAISRSYYSKGDFANVIKYKQLAIQYAPYQLNEYQEYCYMLILGAQLYENANDKTSAEYCRQEVLNVKNQLDILERNTDPLAFMITDTPCFTLDEEIVGYINQLKADE